MASVNAGRTLCASASETKIGLHDGVSPAV